MTINDNKIRKFTILGGVVHLGKSIHSGHYIALTRKNI